MLPWQEHVTSIRDQDHTHIHIQNVLTHACIHCNLLYSLGQDASLQKEKNYISIREQDHTHTCKIKMYLHTHAYIAILCNLRGKTRLFRKKIITIRRHLRNSLRTSTRRTTRNRWHDCIVCVCVCVHTYICICGPGGPPDAGDMIVLCVWKTLKELIANIDQEDHQKQVTWLYCVCVCVSEDT